MKTELTESQKAKLSLAKYYLLKAEELLRDIDDELYKEGSFPESPIGHLYWELGLNKVQIDGFIEEGVEL